MTKAKFIEIEGLDGAGKTTVIEYLKAHLGEVDVWYTREPGGTSLGEEVRGLLKQDMDPFAELLLMSAVRTQHVREVIAPALANGTHVITDRFAASSYAYQIHGKDMLYEKGLFEKMTRDACTVNGRIVAPDVSVFLSVDPTVALKRDTKGKEGIEKFEQEGLDFFRKVQAGYREYYASCSRKQYREIDAEQPEAVVKLEVLRVVREILQEQ